MAREKQGLIRHPKLIAAQAQHRRRSPGQERAPADVSEESNWSIIVRMNEEIIDLKLELIRAEARLTVMRGEQLLARYPAPSSFDEPELAEDPFR
jgi:hypothetical protein